MNRAFRPRSVVCFVSALASFLLPLSAPAQAPQLINYQGRLANGTNLVNGSVGLSLRLFDASTGGTKLYEDSNTVTVVDGLYSTFIGDDPASESFLSALTNPAIYVEAAVNGIALTPRERLASVGYSLATRGLFVSAASEAIVLNPSANAIGTNVYSSSVAGGAGNSILTGADYAFLGGGQQNGIQANAWNAFLGGGYGNSIQPNARYAFLGGGYGNSVQQQAEYSVLGGGEFNSIQTNAHDAFLGGGFGNSIQRNAHNSFLGCGGQNSIGVGAQYAAIPGGFHNAVSNGAVCGFAAGYRAMAGHSGSFVWADLTDADFASTGPDQFLVRASGGMGIGVNDPAYPLDVGGPIRARGARASTGSTAGLWLYDSATASDCAFVGLVDPGTIGLWGSAGAGFGLTMNVTNGFVGIGTTAPVEMLQVGNNGTWCNGLVWQDVSDVNRKEDFAPVDVDEILRRVSELPVLYWNYKEDVAGARHIGPTAQDFHDAFAVGDNDTSISGVDRSGVAFAAIQALAKENAALKKQNEEILERLRALEEKRANVE